jgi:hypothetical protein
MRRLRAMPSSVTLAQISFASLNAAASLLTDGGVAVCVGDPLLPGRGVVSPPELPRRLPRCRERSLPFCERRCPDAPPPPEDGPPAVPPAPELPAPATGGTGMAPALPVAPVPPVAPAPVGVDPVEPSSLPHAATTRAVPISVIARPLRNIESILVAVIRFSDGDKWTAYFRRRYSPRQAFRPLQTVCPRNWWVTA